MKTAGGYGSSDSKIKQCGIDEAGRGPVIGPMVISMVCASVSDLVGIGVKDSKLVSRVTRERLYDMIVTKANVVKYVEIGAEILNTLMTKMTLNEIEYHYVGELLKDSICETFIDCFDVDERRGEQGLSSFTENKVRCIHGADRTIPAVSAASIVSKVIRDRRISSLAEEYGDFGSGYPSDPKTVQFLKESLSRGRDISKIVRVHWATYKRLKDHYGQSHL